jgi:hypothetical protein
MSPAGGARSQTIKAELVARKIFAGRVSDNATVKMTLLEFELILAHLAR